MERFYKFIGVILILAVFVFVNSRGRSLPKKQPETPQTQPQPPKDPQSCPGNAINVSPVGSTTAKVQIKVLVEPSNHCHHKSIEVMQAVGKALPQRIRVEFIATNSPQGQKMAQSAKIGCAAAIVIDGKTQFTVKKDGKPLTITFHGPVEMMPPDYLPLVLASELQSKYGGKVTAQEVSRLKQAVATELAKAEGGKGSGKMSGAETTPSPNPKSSKA